VDQKKGLLEISACLRTRTASQKRGHSGRRSLWITQGDDRLDQLKVKDNFVHKPLCEVPELLR
jgi:hypothetical protein